MPARAEYQLSATGWLRPEPSEKTLPSLSVVCARPRIRLSQDDFERHWDTCSLHDLDRIHRAVAAALSGGRSQILVPDGAPRYPRLLSMGNVLGVGVLSRRECNVLKEHHHRPVLWGHDHAANADSA